MEVISNVKSDISFHQNGLIEISSKVSVLLGINNGDTVGFAIDENEAYIFVSGKGGQSKKGRCVQSTKRGNFMRVNWKQACMKILGGEPIAKYRVGDPIKIDGDTYLPIITRKNYAKGN